MEKLVITIVLLMGLTSSVRMQEQSLPIQQGQNLLRQFTINVPPFDRLPTLNGMLGNSQTPQAGGFLSTLVNLPSRGMQMLSNAYSQFRNMLPGIGRNSNPMNGMSLPNMPSMPDMSNLPNLPRLPNMSNLPNLPNMSNLPNLPNMGNLPNLPNMGNLPMGDRLQQGAKTISDAAGSLANGIRGIIPRSNGVANAAPNTLNAPAN